jgi:hypothetical protein
MAKGQKKSNREQKKPKKTDAQRSQDSAANANTMQGLATRVGLGPTAPPKKQK